MPEEFPIHTVNTEMKRAEEPKVNSDRREHTKIFRLIVNSEIARAEVPEVHEDFPILIVNTEIIQADVPEVSELDSPILIMNSHETARTEVPEVPEDFSNLIHNLEMHLGTAKAKNSPFPKL